jgi:hypothetical protein
MHRGHGRTQRGSQLLELVVTVSLLALVMAALYGGIATTTNALENAGKRLSNLDEARVLMAQTSKDLRTAVRLQAGTSPFVLANANETVLYGNLETTSAPKKIHLYVDATSELVEQVWNADAGSVAPNYTYTGAPFTRFVGRYVVTSVGTPIFTYLDNSGNALTNTPLNATDLLAVKAVRITLVVKKTTTAPLAPVTLVNRVRLANLDYTVTG